MFQSETDDLNFDEEFLNDIFEVPQLPNDQNKRISDEINEQPTKKVCLNTTNHDATATKKLLSFIKPHNTDLDKNRKVVQRKFPGPAGILPEQKQSAVKLEEINTSINKKSEPDVILCSQLSENNFKKGPWQRMLSDWSNNKEKINLTDKYTITWTKCKATAKKLIGQKTPFLAAVIQSIDTTNKDPMIVLKDKTDEIQATLLYEVWDEYYEFLIPGSVIVLKQVGVLSTLKKQYLAITSNNLITIYSEHECEETGQIKDRITKVQELTVSNVIKIIDEIKRNNETLQKKIETPSIVNNPYFKTNKNEDKTKINNSVNKTLQIISNVRAANNMFQPVVVTTTNQNSMTPQRCNKFKFKAKNCNEPNKENTQTNIINNIASTSIPTSSLLNENENDILTQVLDGVDTASIFEDF